MRQFHVCVLFVALGWAISSALGQGLYGVPEMLPLTPEASSPALPSYLPPPSGYIAVPTGYGVQPGYPQTQPQYQQPQYAQTQPLPQTQYPYGYGPDCASCGTGNRFFDAVRGFDRDPCYQPKWYASALGLFLTRDQANGVFTTLDTATGDRLMRTTDADIDWRGGYDVKIGARFGAGNNWAIEGGYWTIDRFRGSAQTSLLPGTVGTPLIVDGIEFVGVNGNDFFNDAAAHRLSRVNRIQSAEVSLLHRSGSFDPLDFSLLAGVRYVVFQEDLTFVALANGGTWGGNGGIDEAYLNDHIINNLIGFQFGVDTGYRVARTLRLFVTPKLGIYNNHIQARFDAFRGDLTRGNPTPASGITRTYPVSVDHDVFAFLGQIDVGLDWEFASRWTAPIGYRLVAATGMGLADHQFPNDVVDFAFLDTVKSNGSLLVHGALAGLKVEF